MIVVEIYRDRARSLLARNAYAIASTINPTLTLLGPYRFTEWGAARAAERMISGRIARQS